MGRLDLSASGSVFLALIYSSFWGIGPKPTLTSYLAEPAPSPQNVDPLGFYDPSSGESNLYVGSTAKIAKTPTRGGGCPARYETASDRQRQLDLCDGAGTATTMPTFLSVEPGRAGLGVAGKHPNGPVGEIMAAAGCGNNTIIVTIVGPKAGPNHSPAAAASQFNNNVARTAATRGWNKGSTGSIQSTNPTVGTIIGGDDVFEAARRFIHAYAGALPETTYSSAVAARRREPRRTIQSPAAMPTTRSSPAPGNRRGRPAPEMRWSTLIRQQMVGSRSRRGVFPVRLATNLLRQRQRRRRFRRERR